MRYLKNLIAILGSMMQQVHVAALITDYGIALHAKIFTNT